MQLNVPWGLRVAPAAASRLPIAMHVARSSLASCLTGPAYNKRPIPQGRASTQRESRSACNDSRIESNIREACEFAIQTPR
jgi:hypothetical protein